MGLSFGNGILLLLLVAAVVAMVSRRLRLPYSVGLVAAGMILALLPFTPRVNLTRELIFDGLLPPLIFEAAFYLNWSELRREMPVVLTLATAGVAASGAVTAAGMHYLAGWEWPGAVVFGCLIAATDPVSVIATFRDAKAHGRLRLLIESESLLNDGTAAVAFSAAVLFSTGHAITAAGLAMNLLLTIAGAVVCGAGVGGAALLLARRTDDHLVELTFTTVAAYGSFLLAERLQFSGVLATIVAGLVIGNRGFGRDGARGANGIFSDRGREAVQAFWDYAAFVANSLVFLLIGLHEPVQHFRLTLMPCAIAVFIVLVSRAVAVYPLCGLFSRSELRVTARHQHALFWGGLRGALALALALGLPTELPRRAEIITVSFAVVAFSIFIQGLTMRPLLRAIGEI
jgi:CPA1 family monovalent cation:H+ antiporter